MSKPAAKSPVKDAKAEAAPKSRKKLIVILVGVLVLFGGGGAAAWVLLAPKGEHATKKEEAAKPPVFLPLETFTVNLQPADEERYLQTSMVVQLEDQEAADALKLYMPLVRNRILRLLSSADAETLATPAGKEKLATDVLAQIKAPMDKGVVPLKARAVLFNDFVIQ